MTTDKTALWAAVLAAPADAAPKLVLADWLEERGADEPTALALRFCVAGGYWPVWQWSRRWIWGVDYRPDGFRSSTIPNYLLYWIISHFHRFDRRGWVRIGGRRGHYNQIVARTCQRLVWRLGCGLIHFRDNPGEEEEWKWRYGAGSS